MEALREQHRFTHCHTVSGAHTHTLGHTDLHPQSLKTAVFYQTTTTSTHRAHHYNVCLWNCSIPSLWMWIIFYIFAKLTHIQSWLCVGVCVMCVFPCLPPILLANLWGFIIGFDKDCHRLERAHTRKSPMLHCGPVSYAERTISKAYVYGRTHTHTHARHTSDTKETEHSQPIYRKTAITFYHAGLGPDRAALSSDMCVC